MESMEKGGGTGGNPSVRCGGQLPCVRGAERCPEVPCIEGVKSRLFGLIGDPLYISPLTLGVVYGAFINRGSAFLIEIKSAHAGVLGIDVNGAARKIGAVGFFRRQISEIPIF